MLDASRCHGYSATSPGQCYHALSGVCHPQGSVHVGGQEGVAKVSAVHGWPSRRALFLRCIRNEQQTRGRTGGDVGHRALLHRQFFSEGNSRPCQTRRCGIVDGRGPVHRHVHLIGGFAEQLNR